MGLVLFLVVLTYPGDNLPVGHLVSRLDPHLAMVVLAAAQPALELDLGFARAEDQDVRCALEEGDNLLVVLAKLLLVLIVELIIPLVVLGTVCGFWARRP